LLDDKTLGQLRYMVNLSRQIPNDRSDMSPYDIALKLGSKSQGGGHRPGAEIEVGSSLDGREEANLFYRLSALDAFAGWPI
jgi:hypothetical protein